MYNVSTRSPNNTIHPSLGICIPTIFRNITQLFNQFKVMWTNYKTMERASCITVKSSKGCRYMFYNILFYCEYNLLCSIQLLVGCNCSWGALYCSMHFPTSITSCCNSNNFRNLGILGVHLKEKGNKKACNN